jgi:tetratricopeptide (TPR) repeat protein
LLLTRNAKSLVIAAGALTALCCQSRALAQSPFDRLGDIDYGAILNSAYPEQALRDAMNASRRESAASRLARRQLSLAPTARDQQIEATYQLLDQGIEALFAGGPQRAIDVYFDPLLAVFEETIAVQPLPTFVARSDREGMYYILTGASRDEHVQAIGSYGPDAYYWKAIALRAMGDTDGADKLLATALEYSPANSWFHSQRASWAQAAGSTLEALAGYEEAARLARLFSPEFAREAELGFALRGRAFILVDLGRFDDAARQYEECLEIDADDREAAVQLAYVRKVIERRRRRGG